MRVCLVGSPTASEFDPQVAGNDAVRLIAEQAPIGILTLAAILERHGVDAEVVDLNRAYYRFLQERVGRAPSPAAGPLAGLPEGGRGRPPGPEGAPRGTAPRDFCSFVTGEFSSRSFDVWGFSTICSSYPLTIRIARDVKRSHPGSLVMLGGPQASVVDVASLEAFPFVDFIVRGEADETLPVVLDALSNTRGFDEVAGVTFRRGEKIVRNPNAPVVLDLDKLPMPAFHQYPELGTCGAVPLELGRGCPFACTFCSTNDFFRRRFRLKSPARMIEQMRIIRQTYGNTRFELIHDMFTIDRKRVVEFCEALLAAGDGFQWNCSARTDCIDDSLIALMVRAGCVGVYFGIETGSARLQWSIDKNLDLREAASRVRSVARHGIRPTVSLITGFPDEERDDLRQTVGFLMDSARFEVARPQLHILAPLAGTPIYEQYLDRLGEADILSDVSYHGWSQDPADRELIRSHPGVFPNFYAVPASLDRQYIKDLRDFIQHSILRCRRLLVALHQDSGDLLEVFDAWRKWLARKGTAQRERDPEAAPYYARAEFADDLLEFVRSRYLRRAGNRRAFRALLDFERALAVEPEKPRATNGAPRIAPGVRVIRLGAEYHKILACLRNRRSLNTVPARRVVVVASDLDERKLQVSQVSSLSAQLLTLCDGRRGTKEIARRLRLGKEIAGIPRHKVCLFGLATLRERGLIEF